MTPPLASGGVLRTRLLNESSWPRLPRARLAALLADAYAAREADAGTVNVLVVDDARIAPMNRQYKKHDGPTDVLAFADGDPDPRTGTTHWGDIMVSAETAAREAAARAAARPDWTASHELMLYALHGLLHLLGMDDGDAADAAAMRAAQTEAFAARGWPLPPL